MPRFRFASLAIVSRARTAEIVTKLRTNSGWFGLALRRSFVTAVALPIALHAARPHYGGTLRIEMLGVIRTFDPAATSADGAESAARTRVLPLVFETLVAADPSGG